MHLPVSLNCFKYMCESLSMCKGTMQTDELLDMISSIARKKMRVRGNLRLEVLLESTYKWLDRELKEKQQSRKRKWQELKMDLFKRPRQDDDLDNTIEMEDNTYEELLGLSDFFSSLKAVCVSPDKNL